MKFRETSRISNAKPWILSKIADCEQDLRAFSAYKTNGKETLSAENLKFEFCALNTITLLSFYKKKDCIFIHLYAHTLMPVHNMLPSISKKRKNPDQNRQLRIIEVKMFPPTARRYPRFDYEEMRRDLGFEVTEEKEANKSSDFHDQDAEEIVRRLEAKYGTQTVASQSSTFKKAGKKSKKSVQFLPEDVMDKGLGYDLEDDFIDDEQAYDEWVPTTMDTAKRGHYVNKGPLEFRQIDLEETTSEDDEENGEESNETGGETSIIGANEEGPMDVERMEKRGRETQQQKRGDSKLRVQGESDGTSVNAVDQLH